MKTPNSKPTKDTVIILQLFTVILIIFFIKKEITTFNNYKQHLSIKEKFANEQPIDRDSHSMILKYADGTAKECRLGKLDDILDDNNKIAYYNLKTLSTYKIYPNSDNDTEPSNNFFNYRDKIYSIHLNGTYNAILYSGPDFNNDRESVVLVGQSTDITKDGKYKLIPNIASIKIFLNNQNDPILQKEANDNNQILLFSRARYLGYIARINVPNQKITDRSLSESTDFSKFGGDPSTNIIRSIILPGSSDQNDPTYRNIKLKLNDIEYTSNKPNIGHEIDMTDLKYSIYPFMPTLDTQTALKVSAANMKELIDTEEHIDEIIKDIDENASTVKENQNTLKDTLTTSLIDNILNHNKKYNYALFKT
jgi:hypothetical protein